ncbi:MAG TPA: type II toxin-antitoxin system prevent-host-death family antitoxin [Ilumatobacter sp.]|nr:type II toxin-antitoxin system prevent-host-death family antitoxin [Ilumatobacter sp.]
MDTISHRELRNNSGLILERVRNGETVGVTNHGELTAVLVPPNSQLIDQLDASGRVKHASDTSPLGPSERIQHALPSSEALDDLRGEK